MHKNDIYDYIYMFIYIYYVYNYCFSLFEIIYIHLSSFWNPLMTLVLIGNWAFFWRVQTRFQVYIMFNVRGECVPHPFCPRDSKSLRNLTGSSTARQSPFDSEEVENRGNGEVKAEDHPSHHDVPERYLLLGSMG